jgi:hypothetical protein
LKYDSEVWVFYVKGQRKFERSANELPPHFAVLCHNLNPSPNVTGQIKSRGMRSEVYLARKAEERKLYKVLMGKPKGKRTLGRPRRRWEDGIRVDLGETDWEEV